MMMTDWIETEFLPFLDLQIEHLQRAREFLDLFRAALIRRDMDRLRAIQNRLAEESLERQERDRQLNAYRDRLSEYLACAPEEVYLSRLCRSADLRLRGRLEEKQRLAKDLVREVKDAHLATELLLRECARINRRMLEAVTGRPTPAPVYDSRGRTAWQPSTGLMNMKL